MPTNFATAILKLVNIFGGHRKPSRPQPPKYEIGTGRSLRSAIPELMRSEARRAHLRNDITVDLYNASPEEIVDLIDPLLTPLPSSPGFWEARAKALLLVHAHVLCWQRDTFRLPITLDRLGNIGPIRAFACLMDLAATPEFPESDRVLVASYLAMLPDYTPTGKASSRAVDQHDSIRALVSNAVASLDRMLRPTEDATVTLVASLEDLLSQPACHGISQAVH